MENKVREYYIVRIYRENPIKNNEILDKKYRIEASKIKVKQWLYTATGSTAYFRDNKMVKFEDYIQWVLSNPMVRFEVEKSGWVQLPVYGEKYVISSGVIGDKSLEVKSTDNYDILVRKDMLGSQSVFNDILAMPNITKSLKCSIPLIVLTHLAVIRKNLNMLALHQNLL